MLERAALGPWVLVGWTVFLWLSRLRNVLVDDDLTSTGRMVRIGVVALFVALAVWAGWGLWAKRSMPIRVLCVWTFGYWLVRGVGILGDGQWSTGFKIVHTALWIVSAAAAAWAWWATSKVRVGSDASTVISRSR